jgi:hypothetical protein
MCGHLIESNAILLRRRLGEARIDDGSRYEIGASPTGAPIIRSRQSGRYWSLTWDELVALALEAGIDAPAPVPPGGCDHVA